MFFILDENSHFHLLNKNKNKYKSHLLTWNATALNKEVATLFSVYGTKCQLPATDTEIYFKEAGLIINRYKFSYYIPIHI